MKHIARQVESMSRTPKPVNDRKLTRLIVEHNQVHHDLILINELFKNYVGYNLIATFGIEVTLSFVVLLDTDWRLANHLTNDWYHLSFGTTH